MAWRRCAAAAALAPRPSSTGGSRVLATFAHINDLRPYRIWDHAVARAVQGANITFAVVDVDPSTAVPEHHHGIEQLGLVLRGYITMTVDGQSRKLGVGDTYVIRGGVPHDATTGPEGATVVDVFAPVREDWQQVERLEPSPSA